MKRVSFKVAQALKKAGYPQVLEYWKYLEDNTYWYYPDGKLEKKGNVPDYIDISKLTFDPTYLEVWLWLWKEKNIQLQPSQKIVYIWPNGILIDNISDVEDGIITAINYLVDNDLIK